MTTTETPLSLTADELPAVKDSGVKAQMIGWMNRSGLHGKLIAGGAILGVICAFLPLVSVKAGGISVSAMILECWQGIMSFLAYIACGAGAWMLYQPEKHRLHLKLVYGLLECAGLIALFALWMAFAARSVIGFGAILNVLVAVAVATGAYLKAKADKVF